MSKQDLVNQWTSSLDSGDFLTPKHDPTGLLITWHKFRTILTPEASSSLDGYIRSGSYDIRWYKDSKFPTKPGLYEIVPSGAYPFSVAGSGVASGSLTPSGSYDRLVVAYSNVDGWHVYAENASTISGSAVSGRLSFQTQY